MYICLYKMLNDDKKLPLYNDDLRWDNNWCMTMMNDVINDVCKWQMKYLFYNDK